MLIPESKSEKEMAHLERMTNWLAKMTPEERAKHCDHGNRQPLARLPMPIGCKYCNEEKEKVDD